VLAVLVKPRATMGLRLRKRMRPLPRPRFRLEAIEMVEATTVVLVAPPEWEGSTVAVAARRRLLAMTMILLHLPPLLLRCHPHLRLLCPLHLRP
jgi:hypothetical protein